MIIPSLCVLFPVCSCSFTLVICQEAANASLAKAPLLAQQDSPPPWRGHGMAKGHCFTFPAVGSPQARAALGISRGILSVVDWPSSEPLCTEPTRASCVPRIPMLETPEDWALPGWSWSTWAASGCPVRAPVRPYPHLSFLPSQQPPYAFCFCMSLT